MNQEQNRNNEIIQELDFIKLNETLASEKFANWYFSQAASGRDLNLDVMKFINTIINYQQENYE
ncbi:MAG: hypothetical protein ACRCXT_20125 [Paraclostridium sp.]